MIKDTPLTRWILIGLMIVSGLLGVITAAIVVHDNRYLPKGILGIVVIYLLYREFSSPMNTLRFEELFVIPKNIRHFVIMFIVALLAYWSLGEIYEMILFIFYRLSSL